MTTPLIILGLLILPCVALPLEKRTRGAISIASVFLFTGVGHFIKTDPMAAMLPEWVPMRVPLVYATGVLEVGLAILLLVPSTRRAAGRVVLVLLVAFLPVNVFAAVHHVPMGGHAWGPIYLWIRVPLQAALFLWTYVFVVRRETHTL